MDSTHPETDPASAEIDAWDLQRSEDVPAPDGPAQLPTLEGLDALTLQDFAQDEQALAFYLTNGCSTVMHAFTLANILHTSFRVQEASRFYRIAFDLHSKNPGEYPLAQSLLQARLLCLLKAGMDLPAEEVAQLRALCIPHANFIESVHKAWREGDPMGALRLTGNAYEEFHTGEEIDSLYLSFAQQAHFTFSKNRADHRVIPNRLFLYWDKNPPEEIVRNFEFHRRITDLDVKIFDKAEAEEWLYDVYGVEARALFLNARHPAEAADILRVHVIQALGGWWLDADIRIRDEEALKFILDQKDSNVLFLTHNNVVHNDFFGSVPQSPLLNECLLNIYRNCHMHQGLFIAYKTGPGVFNRALNRLIHRDLSDIAAMPPTSVYDHHMFSRLIEEFDTPYKAQTIHWQAV
ncbi:glycosyltransferase family 32 protein [Swaminathania salitolerans]|uniref:Uncharacterized protein n=1 Tax=Swaminathania salitolerans TaxID=182838 RepID=A0A511BR30_9PROT|nr:hypothetical protein [Swaminathania salitolerans]GBQ12289.1 hypothetical protein AA21291_1138 [Swaminathania salitolerans LMG 21291]GEL02797.1 hypothetical protein SSA02_19600 [Swaminathania salitolerans]